jgi:hypothetical protein
VFLTSAPVGGEWLASLARVCIYIYIYIYINKLTPWPEPASEPYRPRDRRLSAKSGPTFADRECHVVSADPGAATFSFK